MKRRLHVFRALLVSALLAGVAEAELNLSQPQGVLGDVPVPLGDRSAFWAHDRDDELLVVGVPEYSTDLADVGAVLIFRRLGDEWVHEETLVGDEAGGRFGGAVAVHEGEVIVGAPQYPLNGTPRGGLFFYSLHMDGWARDRIIQGSNTRCFGATISQQGNLMMVADQCFDLIASPGNPNVRVYEREHVWVERQTLVAGDSAGGPYFGRALAIAGQELFVGTAENRIYHFTPMGDLWSQLEVITLGGQDAALASTATALAIAPVAGSPNQALLLEEGPGGGWIEFASASAMPAFSPRGDLSEDFFTYSTALYERSGGGLSHLVTAEETSLSPQGVVAPDEVFSDEWISGQRIFRFDGVDWLLDSTLQVPDTGAKQRFGFDVALDGNRAAVSAAGSFHDRPGATHIYDYDLDSGTWIDSATVYLDDLTTRRCSFEFAEMFGYQVELSGDFLFVSVVSDPVAAMYSQGEVLVFQRQPDGSWPMTQLLTGERACTEDGLGHAIEAAGEVLLVGALGHGRFHFYREEAGTWVHEQELTVRASPTEVMAMGFDGTTLAVAWNGLQIYEHDGAWMPVAESPLAFPGEEPAPWVRSVDVDGDLMVAGVWPGATWEDGPIHTLRRENGSWSFSDVLNLAEFGEEYDGAELRLDGDRLIVIAKESALLFQRQDDQWLLERRAPSIAEIFGVGESLGAPPASAAFEEGTLLVGYPEASIEAVTSGAAAFFSVAEGLFFDDFESGETTRWTSSSN